MNKYAYSLSILMLLHLTACNHKQEEKHEAEKYMVTSPIILDTAYTKEYVAQIQSFQNIEIRAMVKGYISAINVDEGQQVKTGQILFRIMPKEYEAELQKTQAEAKTAELEMLNVKTLADKNIVSQTELSLAKARYEKAKAEVARASLFVSFTIIKAPFDGVIDRIRFKLGSLIDEGTLLTSLSNNKEVYAYFNVTEAEYLNYKTQVQNKSEHDIHLLLANGQPYNHTGEIVNIEGEFDNTTGNIAFRAKFPNPELLLKHGETGKIQLKTSIKNALIIPQKATYEIQDKKYVFVVDNNNVVHSRNIQVKAEMTDLYVIESGISEKEKILLEGLQKVKDDDKITYNYMQPAQVISHLKLKAE
ncbi:efflux transporter periplasmic adaptor subunit [Chitinophagaceae bacterium IBVUCB1]|nr:efflux transporter periplasmic adaptor subunit [Chitinophagaceae bacterium IBVUCB1]